MSKPARVSKYSNKQAIARDGAVFPSKKECRRYEELVLLERIGEIKDLARQVRWTLIPTQDGERCVQYVSDFQYLDRDGKLHVEDTKGFRTKDYIIKRKLLKWVHGVTIEEL